MLMLWFILLAAAVGVRQRFHLSLDLFRQIVPEGVRLAMDAVSFAAVGLFGVAMAWYPRDLILQTWDVSIPGLGISQATGYVGVSVSGALITLFSIEHLLKMALTITDARRDAADIAALTAIEKPND